ncbi:LANO_0F15016g1_1 [Lachancea nothofagi CBS 11611]|uniref:LANO_0F15016g1_1 n=1 Tax=Lachancea nothofagi CBS 11611 TaxID=1266666 RepID=A0A1G4KCK6_9SACH|nr:LANO_0F15016g1_1 [Lachancea nothofagi CBS 11611]
MFRSDWKLSINSKTFDALDCSLFRNFKFMTVVNYAFFVLFLTALKIALFVSDVYTCIKLLAFNSWSNNIIQPYIPFRISKWLFSGCILASIVLILWEIVDGIRIYRTRNISLTFVNNFSRGIYSLSQYNKFCVYNCISPEGTFQKMAFFTFFELKDCLRLLITDTPRQVLNGLTLWSVIVASDQNDLGKVETLSGLLAKIKTIAQTNREEAVLLSFMLFSFIIWAFFITKFALACVCSIFVYYRIINENRRGLKPYVCVTVSEHVNALVEKYQKKRGFPLTHRTTEDLERCEDKNWELSENLDSSNWNFSKWNSSNENWNSSTANLLSPLRESHSGSDSRSASRPVSRSASRSEFRSALEPHSALVSQSEPLPLESPIQAIPKIRTVNTPEQAYFKEFANENRQSLWDRRIHIENQDYDYYIAKDKER